MSLFIVTTINGGELETEIIYNPTTQLTIDPKQYSNLLARPFKYTYKHEVFPPTLFTNLNGEKFITPGWIKVHPETCLDDIEWIKPINKENTTQQTYKVPGKDYVVKRIDNVFTCNCKGFYRLNNKSVGCKHIKEVREKENI